MSVDTRTQRFVDTLRVLAGWSSKGRTEGYSRVRFGCIGGIWYALAIMSEIGQAFIEIQEHCFH